MSEKDRFSDPAAFQRVFSQQDFDRFARLSGDDNPIHVDPEFSARTRFGRTVAHGMLLYSTVCAGLSGRLPGPGVVQLEQELMFPTPTYTGETVTVCLEPVARPAPDQMELNVSVVRPGGEFGLQGRTRVCTPGRAGLALPPGLLRTPQAQESVPEHRGLVLGQYVETQRTYTPTDLDEYAALTGDANPLFGDDDYARSLGYQGRLVPGGLLGGLFSYLLGTRLPGRGTNWLKQRLVFPQPAYANQAITARVEIVRLRPEKELVNLRTTCANPAGEIVCDGEALVFVKDLEG
jgi:acyl dehydratase